MLIKDKIPPIAKKGANGIYRWLCVRPQIIPNMHDSTNAPAKPLGPSHKPPVLINLMSPSPIGDGSEFDCVLPNFSNNTPVIVGSIYPNNAPNAPCCGLITHGNQHIITNPMINNGNK